MWSENRCWLASSYCCAKCSQVLARLPWRGHHLCCDCLKWEYIDLLKDFMALVMIYAETDNMIFFCLAIHGYPLALTWKAKQWILITLSKKWSCLYPQWCWKWKAQSTLLNQSMTTKTTSFAPSFFLLLPWLWSESGFALSWLVHTFIIDIPNIPLTMLLSSPWNILEMTFATVAV